VNDVARGPLNEALRGPLKIGGPKLRLVSLVENPAMSVRFVLYAYMCFVFRFSVT